MCPTRPAPVQKPTGVPEMNELSLSKGHPIETLEQVRAHYRALGIKIRVRFRGPRRDPMAQTCLKRDARTFAVYAR